MITSAQSRINTLANCNHDDKNKIWNQIVWREKTWRRIKFLSSPFRVTSETALAEPALEDVHIGSAVWLVTLKGLDGNFIFFKFVILILFDFIFYHSYQGCNPQGYWFCSGHLCDFEGLIKMTENGYLSDITTLLSQKLSLLKLRSQTNFVN